MLVDKVGLDLGGEWGQGDGGRWGWVLGVSGVRETEGGGREVGLGLGGEWGQGDGGRWEGGGVGSWG